MFSRKRRKKTRKMKTKIPAIQIKCFDNSLDVFHLRDLVRSHSHSWNCILFSSFLLVFFFRHSFFSQLHFRLLENYYAIDVCSSHFSRRDDFSIETTTNWMNRRSKSKTHTKNELETNSKFEWMKRREKKKNVERKYFDFDRSQYANGKWCCRVLMTPVVLCRDRIEPSGDEKREENRRTNTRRWEWSMKTSEE